MKTNNNKKNNYNLKNSYENNKFEKPNLLEAIKGLEFSLKYIQSLASFPKTVMEQVVNETTKENELLMKLNEQEEQVDSKSIDQQTQIINNENLKPEERQHYVDSIEKRMDIREKRRREREDNANNNKRYLWGIGVGMGVMGMGVGMGLMWMMSRKTQISKSIAGRGKSPKKYRNFAAQIHLYKQ